MDEAVNEPDRAVLAGRQRVFESSKGAGCLSSRISESPQIQALKGSKMDQHSIDPDDRQAQKALALDLIGDSVVITDLRGDITYINRAAQMLYECGADAVLGHSAREVLFTHDPEVFDAAWRTLWESGEWQGHVRHAREGIARQVESRWSVARERGRVIGVVMVSANFSGEPEKNADLAHELRNPLASIKGVADALLDRSRLSRKEREWVEVVRREVLKIDSRLRETLDLSRPRLSSVRQFSLDGLVRDVVQLASHQLKSIYERENRRVSLEYLDTTMVPLNVYMDPARIEDAVMNLVLNAIESIEDHGRITVRLSRITSSNGTAEALIEVSDTGCGIPVEIRKQIFEPLFTTKREGTGLGLAAVRRTAAACHGRITFKSRNGRGSTFILALPLRS